ncbi:MAG: YhgE/Pip family protein [Solirubrobacterales bacterium]
MNGIRLAIADIKNMWSSYVLRKTVLGLMIFPLIYSFIYLWATWNPVDYLFKYPLAIVNMDEGVRENGHMVKVGKKLADKLTGDKQMHWELVSETEAEWGVKTGHYYMAVIIPEDFSRQAYSAGTDNPRPVKLTYRINEGLSVIGATTSRKIIAKVEEGLQRELTTRYLKVIFEMTLDGGKGLQKAADGAAQLADGSDNAYTGSKALNDGLKKSGTGMKQLGDGLVALSNGMNQLENGTVKLNTAVSLLVGGSKTAAGKLADAIDGLSGSADDLLDAGIHGMNTLNAGAASLARVHTSLTGINSQVSALNKGAADAVNDSLAAQDQSLAAAENTLNAYIAENPEAANDLQIKAALASVQTARKNVQTAQQNSKTVQDGLKSVQGRIDTANANVGQAEEQLQTDSARLADDLQAIKDKKSDIDTDKLRNLPDQLQQLQDGTEALQEGSTKLVEGMNRFQNGFGELRTGNARLTDGSDQLVAGLEKISGGQRELSDKLGEAAALTRDDGKSAQRIADIADPVRLDERNMHPVPNNGTGFAPYFIALSLWVGSMLLFFAVDLKKVRAMPKTPGSYIINKYLALASVSVFQAIISIFILHAGLGISVEQPTIQLYAFALVTGLSFAAIIFMLVSILGEDVGKFVAVILMMLQLTSCGGSYPVELESSFFGFIQPLLPMTYAVHGLRGIVSIGDQMLSWMDALMLIGYGAVSLVIIYFVKRKSIFAEIEHEAADETLAFDALSKRIKKIQKDNPKIGLLNWKRKLRPESDRLEAQSMIAWNSEYAIGIPLIDEQHQKLFEIAGRAYAVGRDTTITDKYDQIADVIEELRDYCAYHFATEEDYMRKAGCTSYEAHKKIHDDMTQAIAAMKLGDPDENQDQAILGILDELVNWISNHILTMDKTLPG